MSTVVTSSLTMVPVPVSMTIQVIVTGLLAWTAETTAIVTFAINTSSVER